MNGTMAWTRIALGGIGGGILPAVIIIGGTLLYDALGASAEQAAVFMADMGLVVGIGGGFLFTLGFAVWAARKTGYRPLVQGGAVGALSFAADFGLVAVVAGTFTTPILVALALRPPAGLLGGWWVARQDDSGAAGGVVPDEATP